jgi:hypothetical protein
MCAGDVWPGKYQLAQSLIASPADAVFAGWDCWDTSGGNSSTPFAGLDENVTPATLTLDLGDSVTCVAGYTPKA